MEDLQPAAPSVRPRREAGEAPVVLVEAPDGILEVVDAGDLDAATGMDTAALAGARLVELVREDDRTDLEAARRAARDGGRQEACEVRMRGTSGPSRSYEVRFVPGLVSGGLVVLLRDRTHLQRLAAEAAVLRRITELANSIADADEAIRQAVADLRETLGWQAGRVLQLDDGRLAPIGAWAVVTGSEQLQDVVEQVAPDGTSAAVAAARRAVPVTTDELADARLPERLTELGVASVIAVPVVVDDGVTHVLEFHAGPDTVVDDDQRALLAAVGRQLGWVVARQADLVDLEGSHAELARSNAELERFAYVASHDLQEPLRKIVGFTELLRDHHEPLDEDEAEYRRYVVDSAHRLQRLIKDLLAYSRAGRRELASGRVELGAVVDDVLEDLALAIEEAGATVDVGEDLPVVTGDDGQLREVLQNLVSNALKYRAEDRPPRVRIFSPAAIDPPGDGEADELAHVVVADNGIGIEAGHRVAVFEVFRRLHPAHLYGGTGLGLALVDRIVTRHGGTVSIGDSPFGDGIAVHLHLPRHEEPS